MSSQLTVRALLQRYVSARLDLADGTIAAYGYAVGSLERHAGKTVHCGDLSAALLEPWLRERVKVAASKTVQRERKDILMLWRWGWRRKLCRHNPFEADIPPIRVPRRVVIAWLPDEFEALVATAKRQSGEMRGTGISRSAWWSSLLIFLYWSGARISAALAVKTTDLDFRRRVVYLRAEEAKTGRGQAIGLHDQATAAIMTHFDSGRELVWPYPYNPRQKFEQLKRLLQRAGLPADRYHAFHCVRRTTATLAAKHGSIEIAQRAMGHTTARQTAAYLDESQLRGTGTADVLPVLTF